METDKTFKNLSTQYKNYLNEINNVLINFNPKKNYSFLEINNYYNSINDINNKLFIVEKDIELLIDKYDKTNEIIYKLRNLIKKRNTEIIRNLLKSDLYKTYINNLQNEYKKPIKSINESFIELIKIYSMKWKCCWSFLQIDENGHPKKIQLFDINDIKLLKNKLKIL